MVILGLQHGVEFLTILETSFPIHADATRNELRGASSTHHNPHETNHTFRFGAAHIAYVCPSATRRTEANLIRSCHCSVRLYFNGVRSRPSAAHRLVLDCHDVLQGRQQFSAAACAECGDRLKIRVSEQRIAFQGPLSEIPVVRFKKSNPDSVILRCGMGEGDKRLGGFIPFLSGHAFGTINEEISVITLPAFRHLIRAPS